MKSVGQRHILRYINHYCPFGIEKYFEIREIFSVERSVILTSVYYTFRPLHRFIHTKITERMIPLCRSVPQICD